MHAPYGKNNYTFNGVLVWSCVPVSGTPCTRCAHVSAPRSEVNPAIARQTWFLRPGGGHETCVTSVRNILLTGFCPLRRLPQRMFSEPCLPLGVLGFDSARWRQWAPHWRFFILGASDEQETSYPRWQMWIVLN